MGTFDDIACTLDTTGIRIVDISNPGTAESPASFEQVAFVRSPAGSRANDVKVAHLETAHFSGDIMVFTDEPCGSTFVPRLRSRGGGGGPQRGGIEIFDVTDPTNPKSLKRNFLKNGMHNTFIWQDGGNAYLIAVDDVDARDVVVDDGHHAYISWYAEGMRVVDFSSCEPPATVCTPVEIAHYIEDGGSNFWGVYSHTYADGTSVILGSDRSTGLRMFADPVSTGAHQD